MMCGQMGYVCKCDLQERLKMVKIAIYVKLLRCLKQLMEICTLQLNGFTGLKTH
ncbi:hypothetical protein F383_26776 [Gossypium arboreum]|uniref:Uncharacterized protein n=1 Tax=Gossypium arboreum TaxID=29729 RepID=A0A0B0P5Z3_GOSAR|nr:hypothetical protein F383_26776 [Gossypium arboreum]